MCSAAALKTLAEEVKLSLTGVPTRRPIRTLSQQIRWQPRPLSTAPGGAVNVFDRNAKRLQRNRAANGENPEMYDYLKDEVASQLVERVCDIARHASGSCKTPYIIVRILFVT